MSEGQRVEACRALGVSGRSPSGDFVDGAAIPHSAPDGSEHLCNWAHGCSEYAVSGEEVRVFLDSQSKGVGVANRMQRIRWQSKGDILVGDTGLIPKSRSFTRRFACCEAHPGVCATKDANYHDVLRLVGSLERYFVAAFLNHFFQFVISTPDSELRIHFCDKRSRRPYCQITHTFLPLVANGVAYNFQQRPDTEGTFDFHAAWGIAKLVAQTPG
jgi:hypothetical protein